MKTHQFSTYLLTAILSGLLFLFIATLPSIGFGLWFQSEFSASILYIASTALGICLLITKNIRAQFSAYSLFPLGLLFIGLCLMPFTTLPMRHFLGAPQTVEGIALYAAIAILITAYSNTINLTKNVSKIFFIASMLAFTICAGLTFAWKWDYSSISPYYYSDYIAFLLFPLAIYALTLFKPSLPKGILFIYLPCLILSYFSESLIALAFILIGIPIILSSFFLGKRFNIPWLLPIGILIAPLFLVGCIFAIGHIAETKGNFSISAIDTIWQRYHLIKVGLYPLLESPSLFLTGTGWGSFAENIALYLPTDSMDMTKSFYQQVDIIRKEHFHSHNNMIDSLYSSGILGLILTYGWFVSIPFFAKQQDKTASYILGFGLIALTSFWFWVPISIPFICLTLGQISNPNTSLLKKKWVKRFFFIGLLVATITCAIAAFLQYKTAVYNTYKPQRVTIEQINNNECQYDYNDFYAGGLHLTTYMNKYLRRAVPPVEIDPQDAELYTPEKRQDNLERLNHLYCQSTQYLEKSPHISLKLYIMRLITRSEILIVAPDMLSSEDALYYRTNWKNDLLYVLEKAPKRYDLATPYLLWHLNNGYEQDMMEIAQYLYQHDYNNPVGLWFTGLGLLSSENTVSLGLQRMTKALQNGIERFIPIDPATKEQLQQAITSQ